MVLHPNHRFILWQIVELAGPDARALDFGCGDGSVVKYARAEGIDMVGADIFYEGSPVSRPSVEASGQVGKTIFEMRDGLLPFADARFDIVCANQVFEHVHDLDLALAEVRRVLKPGGLFLNIFPSRGVLREGHCGIALAHWLISYPRLLRLYLLLFRLLGFGHNKRGKSRRQWAASAAKWLCAHVVYRSQREIRRAYSKHFAQLERAEHRLAAFRLKLGGRRRAAELAERRPRLAGFAVSSLASMVLIAKAA